MWASTSLTPQALVYSRFRRTTNLLEKALLEVQGLPNHALSLAKSRNQSSLPLRKSTEVLPRLTEDRLVNKIEETIRTSNRDFTTLRMTWRCVSGLARRNTEGLTLLTEFTWLKRRRFPLWTSMRFRYPKSSNHVRTKHRLTSPTEDSKELLLSEAQRLEVGQKTWRVTRTGECACLAWTKMKRQERCHPEMQLKLPWGLVWYQK